MGAFLVLPYPGALVDPRLPSCLTPQDQLKQLQEILGSMHLQEEKTRASQHRLGQQLNHEAQQSSSLVTQLWAMVAEREARVQQLEMETGQLSVQVSRALVSAASISRSQQVHPTSREISATSVSFHLPSFRLHHVLPRPTLAPCFHLAPQPVLHTSFLSKVQT